MAELRDAEYELHWRSGVLGVRFTPNELDLPVVCSVCKDDPNAAVVSVQNVMAIGDVLVAFRVHARSDALVQVESFEQFIIVLQCAELPITMRFRSRKADKPATGDIEKSYSFCWKRNEALGVSMGVDPLSLLAVIISIDPQRLSDRFRQLVPMVGDALVEIIVEKEGASSVSIRTDQMRYEETVNLLKTLERPCTLRFVRLKSVNDATNQNPVPTPTQPSIATTTSPPCCQEPPPQSAPAALGGPGGGVVQKLPKLGKHPRSIATQQSFKVDERQEEMKRFYEVPYAGGGIGLVMKENKEYPQGYHCFVKKVKNPEATPGLENTCVGDELVAIGRQDLKGMSFDAVMKEMKAINAPTRLLFRHPKRQVSISSVGILADAMLMFLM